MEMSGKIVIVTGASRGIGAAAARCFVAAGAKVALVSRDSGLIDALCAEIGPDAIAIQGDVSRGSDMQRAVDITCAQFGRVDVFVANAGVIGPMSPLVEANADDWARTIDVNLKGVFNGMQAVLPGMIAQGSGTFITVSSGAAHSAVDGWSAYCTSKAGAFMLTRSAHLEYGGVGVRVLGLSPGTVATDMQRVIKSSGVGPVAQLEWDAHIPPDWPARALVWMCGSGADAYLGTDISLRDQGVRRAVGLIA